jgi:FMN phosphatase YigB (HAD superfamily)
LSTADLVHVWDTYISSREIGYEKPDPRIYHAALKQLGIRPGQSFFVGHSPEELIGAGTLGMHTIGFNPDDGSEAEHFAPQFADIIKIVDGCITHSRECAMMQSTH